MNKIITPYNLAEQVRLNTKNINNNSMDIDELYNLVDTIPDTSGFYTKTQTDELLILKLNKKEGDASQEGNIYFSTEFSPTISKLNIVSGTGTQLRLLTNSIAINSLNNGELEYFIPKDNADITTKLYVDNLNQNKADKQEIIAINSQISSINNNVNTLQTELSSTKTELTELENKVEPLEEQIEEIDLRVENNTNSILTLNNLIEQSFNTFGSYTSPLGTATDQIIRPILTENIPLDTNYVEIITSPNPNLFTNKQNGRIIFTISLSNLTNSNETNAILGLNIYYNDTLIQSPSTIVPPNWSGSRTITGALSVEQNSTVYVEYVIQGTLSVDAPIQYNIEYNSNSLISSPSSQVTNDRTENPELGINADLNMIYTNSSNISANATAISKLQEQINNLQTQITNTQLPVDSIVISENSPSYGTWVSLGNLEYGQTIIGGSSSNGNVASHNHKVGDNVVGSDYSHDDLEGLVGFQGFRQDGSRWVYGRRWDDSFINNTYGEFYTQKTGNDKNYAYGLGLGDNIQIWKRTA